MYKFIVYKDGQAPDAWPLRNCHLLGSDGNAMQAEIQWINGEIQIHKKESGVAAFALLYRVGDLGELTLQTTLLPEREEPYILAVELARHRLMMLYMRLEEWSMFDLGDDHAVLMRLAKARELFMEALHLQKNDPVAAQRVAQEALLNALDGSEELTLSHAELLMERRRVTNSVPRACLGVGVCLDSHDDRALLAVQNSFDFLQIPMPWKVLVPTEDRYQFNRTDPWLSWAAQANKKVIAGPVIDFSRGHVPEWLYIWEHDYDTVRDLVYEHIKQVVTRYRSAVHVWNLFSGLNVNDQFAFSLEQMVDLVRMGAMLVKKIAPKAQVMIDIRQPWGEYHGVLPRSVPPLRFCELLAQASVPYDLIGLRVSMGQSLPGQYARDMMQISTVIDHFGHQGKSLIVNFSAPSDPVTSAMIQPDPRHPRVIDDQCGWWRKPWSGLIQGRWLEAVMHLAMSRPYVEAVMWQDLTDHPEMEMPLGGLLTDAVQPKKSLRHMVHFREYLQGKQPPVAQRPAAGAAPANGAAPAQAPAPPAARSIG